MKALEVIVENEIEVHLYPVSERVAPLADHVPPGRSLFLVDIENLMDGGPRAGVEAFGAAVAGLIHTSPMQETDHAIVGVNPALFLPAFLAFPGSKVVAGGGPDGADNAIIAAVGDPEGLAPLYHRVVVASGDGAFAGVAMRFKEMGLRVELVARPETVSRSLRDAVHAVKLLREAPSRRDELQWTS